ncbi:unnamed protein product [Lactuca virosa]|uniref:HAT C-terminal dimerisation domain-containing protein n=1 Tax=Lactuca virosa TaxID=75947 RepID=A0AAU9NCG8_9ASTR|nr:unnamed protein product [Lactuca virosa]
MQLHRPLHAARYFLNPSLHFEENFNADKEVKCGVYDVIEMMYGRPTIVTIHEQLVKFNESIGMFGISVAVLMRKKMQPAKWWSSYGDECPKLQHLAIRVLSLTCSATRCERNWSTFDHIYSKKRNRLEQQRLNALVFVKYNINLDTRLQKRKERGETYDPICLSDMESDDEWITEKEDGISKISVFLYSTQRFKLTSTSWHTRCVPRLLPVAAALPPPCSVFHPNPKQINSKKLCLLLLLLHTFYFISDKKGSI